MASIRIRNLVKSYGAGAPVIDGLDLDVQEGEFVTLLGPSGCGKTTTLRCVAGLEDASGGEIWIGDRLVSAPEKKVFVSPDKRQIGLVFQNYALWPHLSVRGNVTYPLRMRRVPRADRKKQVDEALGAVDLLDKAGRPATLLSGGQQQRVALARAMVGAPELLLFDEPLSNLDALLRVAMRREIRRVHDRSGVASLFVTHDQEEATILSDRVLVMRGGQIEQQGSPRDIFRNPATRFVAEFLGYENFMSGTVSAVNHDVIEVRLPDGQVLFSRSRMEVQPGDRVLLTIRTRDARILREAPLERPNVLEARMTNFIFAGDDLRFELDVAGTRISVVKGDDDLEHGLALEPGAQNQSTFVELPPERVVLLPYEPQIDLPEVAYTGAIGTTV
jgi:iron(III) transport system ATP-binding protein